MKRKANECPVNVDWKYCFICQNRQKKGITDTHDKLKTVANNIINFLRILEKKLSVFPQNLWIEVQQTKTRATSEKT